MWDVGIHLLEIRARCACWSAGGPVCRPYELQGTFISLRRGRTLAGPRVLTAGGLPLRVSGGDVPRGQGTPTAFSQLYLHRKRGTGLGPVPENTEAKRSFAERSFGSFSFKKRNCLLSFSKKVKGPGGEPRPFTCVCCKGEGEMGDIKLPSGYGLILTDK